MQITVDIPDDLAAKLEAHGLTPQGYVKRLVDEAERHAVAEAGAARTKVELATFFERLAALSDGVPYLPGDALTRESIYRDHD